ncbi:M20/M25/M40 family metallo-hydrolase [Candidatus Vidania fulgoroideorum]
MIINFVKKFISIKSVTPNDRGCQFLLKNFLKRIGFEFFIFKKNLVTHSIFLYFKKRNKFFDYSFLGHTDVVSENIKSNWIFNPFKASFFKGYIYGRGTSDMKLSISSFIYSFKYLMKKKNFIFIFSSNEEGDSKNGSLLISKLLKKKKFFIKNMIVGEPTSEKNIFDTLKNGRRGSLNVKIKVLGKQGHTAYPEKSKNAIHIFCKKFSKLKYFKKNFDFQVSKIICKNRTINIIPGILFFYLNVRYYNIFSLYIFFYKINYIFNIKNVSIISNSKPYFKKSFILIKKIKTILLNYNIISKCFKYLGGTSDGKYFVDVSKNIVEMGFKNKTSHKYNEKVSIKDFFKSVLIYNNIMI